MTKLWLFLAVLAAVTGTRSKIDHDLTRVLHIQGKADVFVTFNQGTSDLLKTLGSIEFSTRAEKLTMMRLGLKAHAETTQSEVQTVLKSYTGLKFQSFWISNQVFIQEAPTSLIQTLGKIQSVYRIDLEEETELMMPIVEETDPFAPAPLAEEWGVSLIQAPEAWGMDGGNNGEGVVVSTIDTGVRFTHEALRDNYFGDYGWFDPYKFTTEPNDQNGHGTHVTGTIAGQGGIGVAPGSTWMACKGCATSSCAQNALLACGQYIFCPTDTQGENEDCSKAPHLVSNSWGGGQGRPVYHDMINAWIAAGIVPVFANGNSGPRCGSANSPADHQGVIAVGSTTSSDSLSSFSSVGPSYYGDIKPDVSAPGSSVRSSYHSSDTAYTTMSGTSMACPHAAGVIALLKSRDPEISVDSVKKHLFKGIDREVTPTGQNCGGVSEDTWPNNAFGFGRINAFKALLSLMEETP